MATYVICYDAQKDSATPDVTNGRIAQHIKSRFPRSLYKIKSAWFVDSDLSADEIRDELLVYADRDDRILVVRAGGEAAWAGFNDLDTDWLINRF